jgi:tetratricopeptide (TPR) repeat protein
MSRLDKLQQLWNADPSDPETAYMIAQEHVAAGGIDASLEWFDNTLRLDPDFAYAYFHKARSLEMLANLEEARATLREGLERARASGNAKAVDEISGYLESLRQ